MEHEDRDLGAVRTAMLAMLDDFDHIHIERQPLMMVIEKEGVSLSLTWDTTPASRLSAEYPQPTG